MQVFVIKKAETPCEKSTAMPLRFYIALQCCRNITMVYTVKYCNKLHELYTCPLVITNFHDLDGYILKCPYAKI